MSGGIQAFFAQLSPQTQDELVRAASGQLNAQHRSINRNTADASRIRQYLVENDAYAMEAAKRAGLMPQLPHEATSDNAGVGDFQRQNEAFMRLMGDDLMPAPAQPAQPAPRTQSAPKRAAKSEKPYPMAEDPVNPDARPANLAQEEATSHYNRDGRLQGAQDNATNPQEAPQGSGKADDLTALPYILSVLGLRAIKPGTKDVGGRTNASVPANTSPDGGKEVGMARPRGDDIIDAEWSDVEQPKQLTAEQRKLPGPSAERAPRLPLTDEADEFDDVQKILAETLGKSQPRTNFEKSNVKEGDTNPNKKEVPKGAARKDAKTTSDPVRDAVSDALGKGNKANVIRGKTKVK